MGSKKEYPATIEQIREKFGLERRRTAEVLINSALNRFKSSLAIMIISEKYYNVPVEKLDENQMENVASHLARIKQSIGLSDFISGFVGNEDEIVFPSTYVNVPEGSHGGGIWYRNSTEK
jgi:hypothetical protein